MPSSLLDVAPFDVEARTPGEAWQEEYAYGLGIQAYIWGFPWIYLTQLAWLWTSAGGRAVIQASGKKAPSAPVNTIFNVQALVTPETSDGGSPNVDTLYSTAWLDLSREPLVLSVPAVRDRFYSIELASISSDNFAYVGLVATGNGAGNYLIAGAKWAGTVPHDVRDVLQRCPTPIALMLGRTGVNNGTPQDLAAAHAVQAGYRLTPLSRWVDASLPPVPAPHAQVPIGFDFANPDNPLGTWETMNRAMTENPPGVYPAIDQTPLINLFATIGIGPGQKLSAQTAATLRGLKRAAPDGLALLRRMAVGRGKNVNQWTYPPVDIGRAGQNSDYITRSALQALAGILANDPVEAVYLNTDRDSDGELLQADGRYVLTFEAAGDGFPPIITEFFGFWSITLYDSTFNLVKGSSSYSVNSYDPKYQSRQPNGDMTILLQHDKPQDLGNGVYWLQTPDPADISPGTAGEASYSLFLRVYVPGPEVSGSQSWKPPPIVRAD
jgi:hypothetical protein